MEGCEGQSRHQNGLLGARATDTTAWSCQPQLGAGADAVASLLLASFHHATPAVSGREACVVVLSLYR